MLTLRLTITDERARLRLPLPSRNAQWNHGKVRLPFKLNSSINEAESMWRVRITSCVCWYWTTSLGGGGALIWSIWPFPRCKCSHRARFQATNMMSLNPSWGEMSAISSRRLVQADSSTPLGFLRSPITWVGGWNDLLPDKEKTSRFVRKSLAEHPTNPWTLKSPVSMSMGPRENQSLEKSLGSACLHLWQFQAGAMRGGINIPYLNALGNQAFLSQQQWEPVSKVMRELRPPSLPMSVEVPKFTSRQPSAGLINRMGNMNHQIPPQFPFAEIAKAGEATQQGKFWACAFSLPNTDWLMEGKLLYKQRWLMTSVGLEQLRCIVLTANKWKELLGSMFQEQLEYVMDIFLWVWQAELHHSWATLTGHWSEWTLPFLGRLPRSLAIEGNPGPRFQKWRRINTRS